MKRIAAVILSAHMLFSLVACDFFVDSPKELESNITANSEESPTPDTNNSETDENKFIARDQRNSWHNSLLSVLCKVGIYDCELNIIGSIAAGLMDLDFDNTPEVILAYKGGSMGNIPLEIYDLNTGEKLGYYNFSHYDGSDNIYLCVAKNGAEYVIVTKGSIRITDADYIHSIVTVTADRNSESDYIEMRPIFSIQNEGEKITYTHIGQAVDKSEYDTLYQQFLNDYEIIEGTQIQLIKWEKFGKLEWKDFDFNEGIDPEGKQKLVEQMADALISSSQQFIKYEVKEEINTTHSEIPAEYNNIINTYIEMANLTRYKGCVTRGEINDKDYPQVSKKHIDIIFNSLMDGWKNGAYGYFVGYAIKDVNGDGISELFLTDIGYTIYAMFSIANGEIVSHYFSFYNRYNSVAIDANGNFYMKDYGKGATDWYEILQLDRNGELYGITFGHYDMTGFGDPNVYNYFCTIGDESSSNGVNLSDEEYNDLVASYNETLKNLDPDGCGQKGHVTGAAGFEFYQVIIEDLRK